MHLTKYKLIGLILLASVFTLAIIFLLSKPKPVNLNFVDRQDLVLHYADNFALPIKNITIKETAISIYLWPWKRLKAAPVLTVVVK